MFDFTDPFGTGRIRELEYNAREREAAHRGEIEAERARADDATRVANFMVATAMRQRDEIAQLRQMLAAGDEARRGMGEKLNAALEELRIARETKESCQEFCDNLCDENARLKRELDELYKEHEALLQGLKTGGEVPSFGEEQEIGAAG